MIGIIDYTGGNLASVARAVRESGQEALISSSPEELDRCDKLIFPGVGAAGATMDALEARGLDEFLTRRVAEKQTPCLGICIGIQVLFEQSEEDNRKTLGILKGQVKRFPAEPGLKIPQIGWNKTRFLSSHPILDGVPEDEYFYFVNSYHVVPADSAIAIGRTRYGSVEFASLVAKDNWVAAQFHLEKSGPVGLKMLKNFLEKV